jgi:photosystem II stability/assembly factor-like uncharacterized protein
MKKTIFVFSMVFLSLPSMFFAQVGYISTQFGKLFKSVDGGLNWYEPQTSNYVGSSNGTNKIFFIDSNHGFVFGSAGFSLKRTTDGGLSWSNVNGEPTVVLGLSFIDLNIGFCVDENNVYRSLDGGQNWSAISVFNNIYPTGLSFVNSNVGFMSDGNGGYINKTTNGGISWTTVGSVSAQISDIKFINENIGFVCCVNASVYKTTNGGQTWTQLLDYWGGSCEAISLLNNNNLYVVSGGALSSSINGGLNWNSTDLFDFNISTATGISFVTNTASIENNSSQKTSVFPNPASEFITIRKNDYLGSSSFVIYNSLGKIVQTGLLNLSENNVILNHAPGIYYLKIEDDTVKITIM